MPRTVKLYLALATAAILLPVTSGAKPLVRNVLPTGFGTVNRVIQVKAVPLTAVAIWINRKSDCRFLTAPPDFGGIADAAGDFSSAPVLLTAYQQGVTNGDVVCVGPPVFIQTSQNGPIPVCSCRRVR